MPRASKLIKDLDNVADIVGQLGLSVAGAQKAFNVEYVQALAQVATIARSLFGTGVGADEKTRDFLAAVLTRLAPPLLRYQETTIDVRLDLAQSVRASGSLTAGANLGAVSIGASFAAAYGFDYRAAASVRAVIEAKDLDAGAMDKLLARTRELDSKELSLPGATTFDKELLTSLHDLSKDLGSEPAKVETPDE